MTEHARNVTVELKLPELQSNLLSTVRLGKLLHILLILFLLKKDNCIN